MNELVKHIADIVIKELKEDIKAGKVNDPRLILYFGGEDNAKPN